MPKTATNPDKLQQAHERLQTPSCRSLPATTGSACPVVHLRSVPSGPDLGGADTQLSDCDLRVE